MQLKLQPETAEAVATETAAPLLKQLLQQLKKKRIFKFQR
jgi:hypothetical protein